jgi:murein DD-endopeptidase MepM/ murein hydrolase activator NlpD
MKPAFLCTALLLSLGLPRLAAADPSVDIAGQWHGTLAGKLRLGLTLSKAADGTLGGSLVSLDQGGATLAISSGTFAEGAVRFEVARVGGVYEGKLERARGALTGTWTQNKVAQPLIFERGPFPAAAVSTGPTPKPLAAPLDVSVSVAPTAFQSGGKSYLVYELRLLNVGRWECALTEVAALSGDRSLADWKGGDLETIMTHPGQPQITEKSKLAPGTFAIAWLSVELDAKATVPTSLSHRIRMKVGDYAEEQMLETPAVPVSTSLPVLDAPLAGSGWVAVNGPSNSSIHRRALIPVGGRAFISQRFAIDWVQAYPGEGKTYRGDSADNRSYRAYGAEVHAPADGVVTEVKDGIPENKAGPGQRAVPIDLETIAGNHVIVRIGEGQFAFFAHLQPGSVRVKVGDMVHRGQVLGLVGNSGNSDEPHLHFHLSTASSPLASEGLPYLLRSYGLQGKNYKAEITAPGAPRESELPLEGDIVRFPEAK